MRYAPSPRLNVLGMFYGLRCRAWRVTPQGTQWRHPSPKTPPHRHCIGGALTRSDRPRCTH
jgi:hypothetical protein